MSLDDILQISNQYAAKNSNFGTSPATGRNSIYPALRNANVYDTILGYSMYKDGTIGHH